MVQPYSKINIKKTMSCLELRLNHCLMILFGPKNLVPWLQEIFTGERPVVTFVASLIITHLPICKFLFSYSLNLIVYFAYMYLSNCVALLMTEFF